MSLSVYPANLALHEFFQALNFHFTRTTKHQPTRNLHSSTELSAVTSTASQFHAYLFAMCDKIPQNLRVLTREVADYFIVFYHFPGKFVNFVVKPLIYQKFFAYCGFPKNFIDVISPNSRVESKGGEIRDTKTLNLSRNIVSLQVFVDVCRFSPCVINLSRNKHICCWWKKVVAKSSGRSTLSNKFWFCEIYMK